MKKFTSLLLLAVLALGACETVEGFKRDTQALWDRLQPKTDQQSALLTPVAAGCPAISIMPDLKSLVEFRDPQNPLPANLISEFNMVGVQSECTQKGDQLAMEIQVVFTGKLGPKAKANKADKPSFAYPYFIAVTETDTGSVVAKEVFAASVSYGADQKDVKQIETITQNLPIKSKEDLRKYRVMVGFQLDENQLAYNRGKQQP